MPYKKEIYRCPQCQNWFESENDALDCCLSGEGEEIEETTVYFCEGCGEDFYSFEDAFAHEAACPEVEPACQNCNHYENGQRHSPCPRSSLDGDFTACEQYKRAKIVE